MPWRTAARFALWPAGFDDLGVKHGGHHRHPGGHAQRQKPLARRSGDIPHRQGDLLGQIGQHHGIGAVGQPGSTPGRSSTTPTGVPSDTTVSGCSSSPKVARGDLTDYTAAMRAELADLWRRAEAAANPPTAC
jgi:hypothetical protein